MRYLALATDYDGTLATDGQVDRPTLDALNRLREAGRKLILVTGRQLDDLYQTFPEANRFDAIVAENGALLHFPATKQTELLGDRPSEQFIEALRSRQVTPLSVGEVIVATWQPQETIVLETIRELGLELQIIFNKGAVMVLPPGVNKATGLSAALTKLGLSVHNVVAVGDAENDHAFLDQCECAVAVQNALPIVKDKVDWVTQASRGAGVAELIDRLIATDLADVPQRRQILLGWQTPEEAVYLDPHHRGLLLAGTSGGGKSTLATGILERLAAQGYQFCIFDPEGDYENLEGAVILGSGRQAPDLAEIRAVLEHPDRSLVINLLGVKLDQRPAFLAAVLPSLLELRTRTGRPHWLVIDEAHHMLPAGWEAAPVTLPQAFNGLILITVHPEHVAVPSLNLVDTVIAVGKTPDQTIGAFCQALDQTPPPLPDTLESQEALIWFGPDTDPIQFRVEPPQGERHRHRRNYAEGELGDDKWFYFRGPEAKLNLKAQNLTTFMQLAEGVDPETWLYHLHQQDYSRWFDEAIKDDVLAAAAREIETADLSADASRDRIRAAIEERYTLPA